MHAWPKWITPNRLTIGRILAIPLLMVLIWWDGWPANTVAAVVFIFACLTDYWDGNLARARNEVSQLGKLLDPIADKMLISASLVMLVWIVPAGGHAQGWVIVVPTIVIILREFAVSGLRQVAAAEGVVIAAVTGAKVKTILQMVAVGMLIMHHDPFRLPFGALGELVLWVATGWTLWTGYGYFAEYYQAKGGPSPV
ncbi:MAG: CDP-diacylglycerol--glycerol-3-phosphate 3-phosphatidyltransferase [Candidatus Lambdaproteobacteria bacterium]|nr:CDP-diacylglycerol--glycerol-3-phosphate 3-phosphatidyltransferase [Candidatus Lambdaproteobacteria bacterium]